MPPTFRIPAARVSRTDARTSLRKRDPEEVSGAGAVWINFFWPFFADKVLPPKYVGFTNKRVNVAFKGIFSCHWVHQLINECRYHLLLRLVFLIGVLSRGGSGLTFFGTWLHTLALGFIGFERFTK
jgi:hypothetical protein